eukprot:1526424-Rhodomonas_salina.2
MSYAATRGSARGVLRGLQAPACQGQMSGTQVKRQWYRGQTPVVLLLGSNATDHKDQTPVELLWGSNARDQRQMPVGLGSNTRD